MESTAAQSNAFVHLACHQRTASVKWGRTAEWMPFCNWVKSEIPELVEVRTVVDNTHINANDWNKFEDYMRKKEERKKKRKEERQILRRKWETLTSARLCSALGRQLADYYWQLEGHPEGMDGAQRVDILGEPKSRGYLVLIELERGKAHAIDNVLKAWRYIEENVDSKPIILIQIFSSYFYAKAGNKRRMKEAIFIGKQAEKAASKLKYESLGQEYWPPREDSELDTLIAKISSMLSDIRNK